MGWKAVEPMERKGTRRRHHTVHRLTGEQAGEQAVSEHKRRAASDQRHDAYFTSCAADPRAAQRRASAIKIRFIKFLRWRVFFPLFPAMPAGGQPDNLTSIERGRRGACGAQGTQVQAERTG